jgi:hypothetical protein
MTAAVIPFPLKVEQLQFANYSAIPDLEGT